MASGGSHGARGVLLKRIIAARSRSPPLEPSSSRFITPELFYRDHLHVKRPGHFPKLVSDPASPYLWPACSLWGPGNARELPLQGLRSLDSLQKAHVDVEVSRLGRGYGDKAAGEAGQWFQARLPFETFHDAFIDGAVPSSEEDDAQPMVGYVAQQDLFDVAPALQAHCPPLPHSSAGVRGDKEQWRRNVWIGGAGTFTPIHRDPYENLFAQVVGTKRVHLFPPGASDHLRLFTSGPLANTSSIPTEEALLDLQGESDASIPAITSFHVLLHPGDVLYVPEGWFHCVASLSVSASVNAWFR